MQEMLGCSVLRVIDVMACMWLRLLTRRQPLTSQSISETLEKLDGWEHWQSLQTQALCRGISWMPELFRSQKQPTMQMCIAGRKYIPQE